MSSDSTDVKHRARGVYQGIKDVWPATDPWSVHTEKYLGEFVQDTIQIQSSDLRVLNAGSGNNDYGLSAQNWCVNADWSVQLCRNLNRAVVGDVETLPFHSNIFDVTLCVGAVLNYTEPYVAIPELFRVTRAGGLVIIDFQTSSTAELLFTSVWGKRVSVVEREYANRIDKTYLFSLNHIVNLVNAANGTVIDISRYHTTAALWRRAFPNAELPAAIVRADRVISRLPCVSRLASNAIFVCRKR
jgi:SAM-dependent methyltransferase